MCQEWRSSFERFLADVGRRPSTSHSIDRIDVNGHYEPGNVRWATSREQQRNKTNSRLVTARGQTLTVMGWAEITGLKPSCIYSRLDRGWNHERAVGEPTK